MKTVFIIALSFICLNSFSQANKKAGRVAPQKTTPAASTDANGVKNTYEGNSQIIQPTETVTERYLKGPTRKDDAAQTSGSAQTTNPTSPFAGGVHAADNASKTFDTVANRNNTTHQNTGTTIRGGNDTTFNVNTTVSQGGVTTNSGAVDRSGQAQFGQTNWGNSRSTVGESQWTIPPPITASFNKDFPATNSATWTRNNVDTTIYSARYKSGPQWVTTNYSTSGQRLSMRTEYPLVQPPAPVTMYLAKQPAGFKAATIYKLQVQGKPDVYEIETSAGKKIDVNNDGMEVNY